MPLSMTARIGGLLSASIGHAARRIAATEAAYTGHEAPLSLSLRNDLFCAFRRKTESLCSKRRCTDGEDLADFHDGIQLRRIIVVCQSLSDLRNFLDRTGMSAKTERRASHRPWPPRLKALVRKGWG